MWGVLTMFMYIYSCDAQIFVGVVFARECWADMRAKKTKE